MATRVKFPYRTLHDFPGVQRNFEYLETVDLGGSGATGPPGPAGPQGPQGPPGTGGGGGGGASYTQQIGNGSSQSFTVAHNLGLQGVIVTVYRSTAPYDEVEADVEHTDANTVTVRTTLVPSTNGYTVVVAGPGATGGDLNYVYNGTGSPASSWTVTHNLGKFASVIVVDTGLNVLLPDVHYVSVNQLTVGFGAPTTGWAYIN